MTPDLAITLRPIAEPSPAPLRAAGPQRDAGAAPPAPAPATPNPRLRLDGNLGMVVIEFRDAVGEVANSIPSPRQMEAYRAAAISNAPAPAGLPFPRGFEAERAEAPEAR